MRLKDDAQATLRSEHQQAVSENRQLRESMEELTLRNTEFASRVQALVEAEIATKQEVTQLREAHKDLEARMTEV